jgi:hypothetical protein
MGLEKEAGEDDFLSLYVREPLSNGEKRAGADPFYPVQVLLMCAHAHTQTHRHAHNVKCLARLKTAHCHEFKCCCHAC